MVKVEGLTVVSRGRHVIRAGVISGKPIAYVFLGRQKIKDCEFSGASVEEAVDAASTWINMRTAALINTRRAPHIASQIEYESF